MDNASNCDKLAEILPEYLPLFWGVEGRLRCLAHIFNLIAKVRFFDNNNPFYINSHIDFYLFLLQKAKDKEKSQNFCWGKL
jgi:hypothetical protein